MSDKLKILYAEDSPTDVELTLRVLKQAGLEHDCRSSGDLAELEGLLAGGGYDVFLSDFNLKKFDAGTLLQLRNRLAPELPFIIITGTLPDESAVDLLRRGATDYVLKDRLSRLPTAIVRAMRDAEDRRRLNAARKEMEESEARYRELFESSTDLIFLVSREGYVTAGNPSFRRLTGLSPSGLTSLKPETIVPEDARADFAAALAAAAAGGAPQLFETVFTAGDGRRLNVQGSFYPRGKDGRTLYVQGVFRDITEQRALEEQFRQAQKMDAVGRLAGGIAHDFNNILGAIEGYATLTLNTMDPADPVRPDIEEIRKAVERAASLTKQLLIFSRKKALQRKPCSLNGVVEGLQKMMRRLLGEDVTLELDLRPDLPALTADAGQLEQLLMNLLVNSRDAMPDGGAIKISTRAEALEGRRVKSPNPAEAGTRFVAVSVRDTGCGMSREVLDHIFEPFFTTKEKGKGTGLGLATVYGVVKQHNGWIEVESAPGQGTEFTIYLPAGAPVQSCEPLPSGKKAALPRCRARVLVIEDDKALRDLAEKALKGVGHEVVKAGGAAEGLELFKTGDFDIVFSDMILSDRKIMDIIGDFVKVRPGVRFLFTSGYLEDKANWEAIKAAGHVFLPKPYSIEALLTAIDGLMASGRGDMRKI